MSAHEIKNSLLRILFAAIVFGLVGCVLFDSRTDPSYVYSSPVLYDAAKLIQTGEFEDPRLLPLLSRFVGADCQRHNLARLTLSATRSDLTAAFNVSFPEADPARAVRNGLFRLHFGRPELAQVWCFDNQATAIVRRKNGTTRHQLAGGHDARELTINGINLALVGVNGRGPWPALSSAAGNRSPDTVWLYARVKDLPELNVAKSVHDELESKIGSATFLILRTDPFFVEYDGPAWDIFADSLPEGSAVRFLNKLHIVCAPKATGGGCLLVTSPPTLPAEAWGRDSLTSK